MKRDDIDLDTARIRSLQAIYSKAHLALRNWGLWAGDKRGIAPTLKPPALWDQFVRSKVESWGEEQECPYTRLYLVEAKAERAETDPYDEKAAILLDERLHSGHLNVETRLCLKTAYTTKEVPDHQFPRLSGCTLDAFCERLETALRYAGRFA